MSVYIYVCACVWKRERERERCFLCVWEIFTACVCVCARARACVRACMCLCVCVCVTERQRERERRFTPLCPRQPRFVTPLKSERRVVSSQLFNLMLNCYDKLPLWSMCVDTRLVVKTDSNPSWNMASIQRRLNVDATSWRCIDVETTLYKYRVPAGKMIQQTPIL